MALSFNAVKKAYGVFNQLKREKAVIPDLDIRSWPDDMSAWDRNQTENPPTNQVLGWDRKMDDGWEQIFFFVQNPSNDLIEAFDELKGQVPNSSILREYNDSGLWVFGWF